MATNFIKGRDLMLFDNEGKSFAYATNHTFNVSAETADISSKDHGIWGGSEVTKFTWEITSDCLYVESDYNKMFDLMLASEQVTVRFGIKSENDNTKTVVDGDYDNWTSKTTGYYEGKVYITSLNTNANNGENATYSVTMTGCSKIVRKTA